MNVAATILAGAVGGLPVAFVTLVGLTLTTRWKIAEENVIKERAKWRDAVRILVEQAVVETDASKLRVIATGLALRMNPELDSGKDDRELVALIFSLEERANRTDDVRARIVALAAHILKHDWSRAKWEADHWDRKEAPVQTKYVGPHGTNCKGRRPHHEQVYLPFSDYSKSSAVEGSDPRHSASIEAFQASYGQEITEIAVTTSPKTPQFSKPAQA